MSAGRTDTVMGKGGRTGDTSSVMGNQSRQSRRAPVMTTYAGQVSVLGPRYSNLHLRTTTVTEDENLLSVISEM